MWLCRHSSACSPGGVGGEVHASMHYWVTDLGQGIEVVEHTKDSDRLW